MTYSIMQTLYPALARGRKADRRAAPSVVFVLLMTELRTPDNPEDGERFIGYRVLLWDASADRLYWVAPIPPGLAPGNSADTLQRVKDALRLAKTVRLPPDYGCLGPFQEPVRRIYGEEERTLRAWLLAETDTGCGAPAERVTP